MIYEFEMDIRGNTLLSGTPLILNPNHRYGLIGKNGVGKTTLMRLIASGQVIGVPKHLKVFLVEQEAKASAKTVVETVLEADEELNELREEEEELILSGEGGDRLSEVMDRLAEMDAYTAETRARKILSGLRFSPEKQDLPVSALSGGWRMRVSLACALFVKPDILMLDEPTNHLDLHAIIWLENWLEHFDQKILLVISHDRAFLNSVCTDIIHFYKQKLHNYPGNYDTFVQTREDQFTRMAAMQEALSRKRQHVADQIKRMRERENTKNKKGKGGGGKGREKGGSGQIAAREKKLVKMGMEKCLDGRKFVAQSVGCGFRDGSIAALGAGERAKALKNIENINAKAPSIARRRDPTFRFSFPEPPHLESCLSILSVHHVSFGYNEDQFVINDVSLNIDLKTRTCILGRNGSGKSTLLSLIMGNLTPQKGEIKRHGKLRIGYFSQYHVDQLKHNLTPLEHMRQKFGTKFTDLEYRTALGRFGLVGKHALKKIHVLSGGQKTRVAFASITFSRPHLLILDEPTNHLDFQTIEALIDALLKFEGGVILVSHDQMLLNKVAKDIYCVKNSKFKRFEGSMGDYKKKILRQMMRDGSLNV